MADWNEVQYYILCRTNGGNNNINSIKCFVSNHLTIQVIIFNNFTSQAIQLAYFEKLA